MLRHAFRRVADCHRNSQQLRLAKNRALRQGTALEVRFGHIRAAGVRFAVTPGAEYAKKVIMAQAAFCRPAESQLLE